MIKFNELNQMEIYNVIPVYRGNRIIKFLTSVSISDILKVENIVKYDTDTQRGQRIKNGRTENIMNKKNIEEMMSKILDSFFDGSMLTWNVRISDIGKDKDVVRFSPLENKITILTEDITLPDSAQRHTAIWGLRNYTFSIDQDNYCFPLNICLYTFAEEQSLFSEINAEGSKASRTRGLYLSHAHKNILVKDIIKNSKLKDNVEIIGDTVYKKDKVVAFATLYSSLFDRRVGVYKDLQEEQSKVFKDWMIRFYDELVDILPELNKLDAKQRFEHSQRSISTSVHAWHTYAYLAKLLEGDSNWKRKLRRLNSTYKTGEWQGNIFSIENKIWWGTISMQSKSGSWKLVNNRNSQEFCKNIVSKFLNLA